MIPEIGHFALIIALCLALALSYFGLIGAYRQHNDLMSLVNPLTYAQCLLVVISFFCLTYSFISDDFTVLYVSNNSHTELPSLFKISAVWGAHEGSLLLWILILTVWMVLVAKNSDQVPRLFISRVIGILSLLNFGFLLFTLFTSNPFLRLTPAPFEGADLNPLLQDIGLAIHPPILYVGYVGFAVAYAFAIAAMLSGNLDKQWAKWTRPWTTAAWLFLTIGIALGSWWAYYELGWGGWWFWDPVENASFMPWLVGTALIHSLAVTEKRGLFKSWTLLLAISAFSLSLLGTFLVRSGILISVHAFATDPARGIFILMLLLLVIGGGLLLYAFKAQSIDDDVGFNILSRETFLLLNNVLLVIAATLILLGTLAPLVLEVFNAGKISIGPPWFELAMIVPMLPLIILIGVGMNTSWIKQSAMSLQKKLLPPVFLSILIGIIVPLYFYGDLSLLLSIGSVAATWIIIASILPIYSQLQSFSNTKKINRSVIGMSIAHLGLGLFVFGVVIVSSFGIETDRSFKPGESISIAGYDYKMRGLKNVSGPNYTAVEAEIDISKNNKFLTQLRPQKRTYRVQQSPMTEAGISAAWNRDLFVALGEDLGDGSWSIRVQYKPMIRWIWFGCFVMALGGLIAISDKRYRNIR